MNSSKFPYIDMMVSHIFGNKYQEGISMLRNIILTPERFTPVMVIVGPPRSGKSLFCDMVSLLNGFNGSPGAILTKSFCNAKSSSMCDVYTSVFMELKMISNGAREKDIFNWLNETIGLVELEVKEPYKPLRTIPNRMNFAITDVKHFRQFENHDNYMILHVPPFSKKMAALLKRCEVIEKWKEEKDNFINYLNYLKL